jgi:hypothetical protein
LPDNASQLSSPPLPGALILKPGALISDAHFFRAFSIKSVAFPDITLMPHIRYSTSLLGQKSYDMVNV